MTSAVRSLDSIGELVRGCDHTEVVVLGVGECGAAGSLPRRCRILIGAACSMTSLTAFRSYRK
jgi:hypothetical protein